MPKKYFLLNNHVKFYFDLENRCVENEKTSVALEPKEAQILKYVIENNVDKMISSEEILDENWDYWSNKKVLQKVLSTLRKKLAKVDLPDNCFIAAGVSYQINIHAELTEEVVGVVNNKSSLLQYKNSKISALLLLFIFSVLVLYLMGTNSRLISTDLRLTNIVQVSSSSGMHIEPDFSPRDDSVVFSKKNSDIPSESKIVIKDKHSNDIKELTASHYDQVPVWSPSGEKVVFQRYEKNKCEVRLLTLDKSNNKVGTSEVLTTCNKNNSLINFTWENEHSLLFTDKTSRSSPYNIFKLNLLNKKVTPYVVFSPNYKGVGHYHISYNRELSLLYTLESPDRKYSRIYKIQGKNDAVIIKSFRHKLMSFGFIKNGIIVKGVNNQLESFLFNEPNKSNVILNTPAAPIAFPVLNVKHDKIAFVTGNIFKNGIVAYNIELDNFTEEMAPEVRVIMPQKNGNELLYVSNKTGINQLYSFVNNRRIQLTHFISNKTINHYSTSKDNKWLAISFDGMTTLYRRTGMEIKEVNNFINFSYASFSNNNQRVILSSDEENSNLNSQQSTSLIEFELTNFTETGLTVKDALFGVYDNERIVYISNKNTLRAYDTGQNYPIFELADEFVLNHPSLLAITEDYLFVSSGTKALKIDKKSNLADVLPKRLRGEITANGESVYFKTRRFDNMVIYQADISVAEKSQ